MTRQMAANHMGWRGEIREAGLVYDRAAPDETTTQVAVLVGSGANASVTQPLLGAVLPEEE